MYSVAAETSHQSSYHSTLYEFSLAAEPAQQSSYPSAIYSVVAVTAYRYPTILVYIV
jgi:hypothetical protein